jgi:cell division septal protein FtsQ
MSAAASRALLDRRRSVTAEKARRRRTALLTLIAASATLAGGWWVVTGPPGRISSVTVSGYEGPDAAKVRDTITRVARTGSMVDPPVELLRRAVAGYPGVEDLHVRRDLPRGISVVVVPAVGGAVAVPDGGSPMLLSSSGRVLGPAKGSSQVPRVRVGKLDLTPGTTVKDSRVAAALVLSANLSPKVAGRLMALRTHRKALVGKLKDGPEVRFGPPYDLPAKAESLDLVLGQLSAADELAAVYIDLSVPWYPAVGDRAAVAARPTPPPPPAAVAPTPAAPVTDATASLEPSTTP